MQNRRLRQVSIFRGCRYKNSGVLCTTRTGGDGRRQEQKCRTEGCGKRASVGVAGTKPGEYCAQHAPEGMVNVRSKKCRTEGCGKQPLFGVAGTKTVEYCAQHAPEGMVNVKSRKCRTEGCGRLPSFGVAGTKTVEYCAQHAPEGMVNVKSRKCRSAGLSSTESRSTVVYCVRTEFGRHYRYIANKGTGDEGMCC